MYVSLCVRFLFSIIVLEKHEKVLMWYLWYYVALMWHLCDTGAVAAVVAATSSTLLFAAAASAKNWQFF